MAYEITLKFKDSENLLVLREKELIDSIPVFRRALNSYDLEETADNVTVDREPFEIKFSKESGDFLFKHLKQYKAPDVGDEEVTPEDYPEANQKSLEELKEILELANYLECDVFMQSIGFVIAKKLNEKSIDEIAEFLGFGEGPDGILDPEWIHKEIEESSSDSDSG